MKLTTQQLQKTEKDLQIFRRQREKLLLYIEETKAYIEEITAQIDKYPDDVELPKALAVTNQILAAKYVELSQINLKISGAEYILEQ